jgi:hypothetical protein
MIAAQPKVGWLLPAHLAFCSFRGIPAGRLVFIANLVVRRRRVLVFIAGLVVWRRRVYPRPRVG